MDGTPRPDRQPSAVRGARALHAGGARRASNRCAADGRTTVVIVGDGAADRAHRRRAISLRESARDAVQMLRDHGVRHIALLTGDHEPPRRASSARRSASTKCARACCPPTRSEAVEALRRAIRHASRWSATASTTRRRSPRPTSASPWASAGSAAALETADVALMADELMKIPYALRLSRATVRNIRANIAFSIGLKAASWCWRSLGVATLWMAVVADMGASLIVIANALRLLRE